MEAIGDLIIVLSTFAAAAALWFKFSSARAAKRALDLIRRDAPQREPGLKVEVQYQGLPDNPSVKVSFK